MRVKYIGENLVAMHTGKTYDVIAIEKGWYRILTEIGETYLFQPKLFEEIEETGNNDEKTDEQRI